MRLARIEEEGRARRAMLWGPFGLGRPRKGGSPAPPPGLLIDDCEVAWTGTKGLMRAVSATPTAGGTGYTMGDILDVTTGGAGGQVEVTGVSAGVVTAVAHYAGGYGGYSAGAGKATSGGTGAGCTVAISGTKDPTVAADTTAHDGTFSCHISGGASIPKRALLAYHATGTLDLSLYATLHAWVLLGGSALSDDAIAICLCSDTAGRVVVDEFRLDGEATNVWVDQVHARTGAGPLGAAIQSVAAYSLTAALGTGSIDLDQIRVNG